MKAKIGRAIERAHSFLGAVEELYDADLMVMASNALLPIYLILKSKQGMEQDGRHLRLIEKES